MPIYDYGCKACGAEVELEHKMSETRKKCPKCGKMQLKHIFKAEHLPAIHDDYSPMHPRAGRGRGGQQKGLPS